MSTTYGHIAEFDDSVDDWNEYIERLEQFFLANDMENATKKKAVLLSSCGRKTYSLFRNLLAPAAPSDKTYAELVQVMKDHKIPRPSIIVERFKFFKRDREDNESISTYISELRKLTRNCEFGGSLEDMLRDRLVCGVRNNKIQQKLLSEATLTFAQAVSLSSATERAEQNLKDLHESKDWPVHAVKAPTKCFRCGKSNHTHEECRFKNADCYICHKRGHIAPVCKQKNNRYNDRRRSTAGGGFNTNCVEEKEQSTSEIYPDGGEIYTIYSIPYKRIQPIKVTLRLNQIPIEMEVDTGASLSIINQSTFAALQHHDKTIVLKPTQVKFRTYTGGLITVMGLTEVIVEYKKQSFKQPVFVVSGDKPCLLGRDWLYFLKLDWEEIFSISLDGAAENNLDKLLSKYAEVFNDELGTLTDYKAHIYLKKSAEPKFLKSRSVPYALKGKIEEELRRQVEAGILEQVEISEWATPIVPILKPDKSVRICGDYKLTVNKNAIVDNYPIPSNEDLFATLAGGVQFSKLDLSHAYQQVLVDEQSRELLTINTHKGLFMPTRLPYGIHSAPGIFQRQLENRLKNIDFVKVRIDDILISGRSTAEHLRNLDQVFGVIKRCGLKLKLAKCEFMEDEVIYLGNRITKDGVSPVFAKVEAISAAPAPRNVTELKSFLGILNYYHRYIPNAATLLEPLHSLLRKEVIWTWGKKQVNAFTRIKDSLCNSQLLIHYDPDKDLIMSCDASPYGLGVVLAHRLEDGTERPISYASRSLSTAERNYSHLQKEALSIIYGITKFHQYCFGRRFEIYSDHKPLEGLFSENKPIPAMAAARIQRWAIKLAAYDYVFKYKPGNKHSNADGLSRLPLPDTGDGDEASEEVIFLTELDSFPVTAAELKIHSRRDPVISKVIDGILTNKLWDQGSPEMKPYVERKDELSVEDGCLLWGNRVVIPMACRSDVLEELHQGHPGITRIKALARSYVWWPNLDAELENMAHGCHTCQLHQKNPSKAPLHPWEASNKPWQRIHIDYAELNGKTYLVIVDSYSKWLDVVPTRGSTSGITIRELRRIFATHGLPEICVSDNGPAFTSEEYATFMSRNGIRHITTAPYHPASNGQAERAVGTFKSGFEKMQGMDDDVKLQRFLFTYRCVPHSTTGIPPAELLMGRRLRSVLDLLKPSVSGKVEWKQTKISAKQSRQCRDFVKDDYVYVKNFSTGPKWLPGRIVNVTGPLSYVIELDNGRFTRRHVDHIRKKLDIEIPEVSVVPPECPETPPNVVLREIPSVPDTPITPDIPEEEITEETTSSGDIQPPYVPRDEELRRSTRDRYKPTRYGDNIYD